MTPIYVRSKLGTKTLFEKEGEYNDQLPLSVGDRCGSATININPPPVPYVKRLLLIVSSSPRMEEGKFTLYEYVCTFVQA